MKKRVAIIGGGISGLSAGYFLQQKYPECRIDLFDSAQKLGGVIKTESVSGCILEAGPDSFLTIKKPAIRLCESLGLGSELVTSNDDLRKTFIFHEGQLKPLPDGFFLMAPTQILPLIKTDLFTWPGKFEALADLFSYPEKEDCTVADFVERRFGKEILLRIAEPLLSGIYGADVSRLSLESSLPQLWELQKKGSIIKEHLRRRNSAPKEPLFTTLKNGMESLVVRLRESIRANWRTGTAVESIARISSGWRIGDEDYDFVLLASRNFPQIEGLSELRSLYNSLHSNSAIVIAIGFEKMRREGFGWLVPKSERQTILACTYVSNKFPGRSPEDIFLVRVFIGGDQASHWLQSSEEEIQAEALRELRRIAGIDAAPIFSRIFRWPDAMPEYRPGHLNRIEAIDEIVKKEKGLAVTGNIFSGVGIPDCIQHAEKIVSNLDL